MSIIRFAAPGLLALLALTSSAQAQTVGLFVNEDQAAEGYTLFGPQNGTSVYLINNDGLMVHEWVTSHRPGLMGYLLPNGDLLRAANISGDDGKLQQFAWDGRRVWDYDIDGTALRQHHDIEPLPNGNVLFIAWETKTAAEAIGAGLDPAKVEEERWPLVIVEVRPIRPQGGEIVWQWHAWDHLVQQFDPTRENFGVVAEHPELIDLNAGEPFTPSHPDWIHANGVDYNEDLDQIVISARNFSELWVIDHGTTTTEAAGHTGGKRGKGGDLLYRWGNPQTYGRGTAEDRVLYFQHDTQWVPPGRPGEGNLMAFNNGLDRPDGAYSSVEEIAPPLDDDGGYVIDAEAPFAPAEPVWSYSSPETGFYSPFISGVERQPNGNTLICEGTAGHLFEVTPAGQQVWSYVNPVHADGVTGQGYPVESSNIVFKARRYAADYPAFPGRDLTPRNPLERFSSPRPVPKGSLVASRMTSDGAQIEVAWDGSSCSSSDYHLLVGDLSQVSEQQLFAAECNLGIGGSHFWGDVPEGSLFFVIVGTDETGVYESTWGADSQGDPRNGYTASFRCGTTTKIVPAACL